MPIMNDVTFLYTKIQNPVPAYNKIDSEWSVDVVASKKEAKAIKKEFPKTSLHEYDNGDFEEKYGIKPPFPEQDEQYVLKFKKAHIKNGKETPEKYRPRVIQEINGERVDITFEKLVGNGSKGKLSYRIKETDTYGNFAELQAILVTDLVEYTSKSAGVTDEFGPVTLAEAPKKENVTTIQGEVAPEPQKASKSKPNPPVVDGGDEEGCPF